MNALGHALKEAGLKPSSRPGPDGFVLFNYVAIFTISTGKTSLRLSGSKLREAFKSGRILDLSPPEQEILAVLHWQRELLRICGADLWSSVFTSPEGLELHAIPKDGGGCVQVSTAFPVSLQIKGAEADEAFLAEAIAELRLQWNYREIAPLVGLQFGVCSSPGGDAYYLLPSY